MYTLILLRRNANIFKNAFIIAGLEAAVNDVGLEKAERKSAEKEATTNDPVLYACGFSRRGLWVSAGILSFIIIAIGLGLGIGIGLPAARNSTASAASNPTTLPSGAPSNSRLVSSLTVCY